MKKNLAFLFLIFCTCLLSAQITQVTVVPANASWKYLDDGSNQGTAWYGTAFNDASWASGNAQLGYGEGDEATVLSYGPSASNKHVTHYFRKSITVASGTFTSFSFDYKVDDGMVVYVNGVEAFRANMPAGVINYTTLSTGAVGDGQTVLTTTLSASTFSTGTNLIAVEVHQNALNSSDETFEMSVMGNSVTTGPPMTPLNATVFPANTTWKYLDDGSNQGTGWYAPGFNDLAWSTGTAQFGFGENDEATLLNACGTVVAAPSCTNKYITHYFRKNITLASVAGYTAYTFNYKRDDGIIVYVNGTEAFRDNMPAGAVNYTTWAATNVSDDGQTVVTMTVPANTFSAGTNVVAVELHNRDASSSDATFEMELLANTNTMIPVAPTIVKGPYLQVGTQNSMVIRWETNILSDSKVMYSTNAGTLSSVLSNTNQVTLHEIKLTGLTPYTKYFYNIGTGSQVIQGDTNNYFVTSPLPGTEGKYRFWVIGDCGNASSNQLNVKNQFKNYNGNRTVDGWLTLGDNAYSNGSDPQFNAEFFSIYQNDVMKNKVLWPSPGNHDYNNGASTATTVPYFSIFNTPTNAEAGGVPSGNPAYYSYDYGNIHFISLDSYGKVGSDKMYDTLGAQAVWLKADLAANTKKWTIAYWHHPPYTMGSHNSDTESDLVAIRQKFIRILERNKVDLILCGHSHDYERSKLMQGHYGAEATFNAATHHLSQSSGLYDGSSNSCPYVKDSVQNKTGTVYVLSGSSGQLGGQQGSFPHDAMYYSNASNGGSLILDIEGNRLDAKWLCADGVVRDKFTMYKDVNAVKTLTLLPAQTKTLEASWPGTYDWGNGVTSKTISVSAAADTTIWVKDPNTCIADTFRLRILPAVNFTATAPYCTATAITFTDLSTNNTSSWLWSVTPSSGVTISSATAKNPTMTFAAADTYTVSLISENAYGAGTLVTRTITLTASPIVQASLSSSVICAMQTATLTAGGASSYLWDSGATSTLITVNPNTTTTYTVTGTDLNGCKNTSIKTLSVNALPSVNSISSPITAMVCSGETITLSGNGANTYAWSGGITNGAPFTANATTDYTVTGTDLNGCQNTAIASVSVNALPVLTINTLPANASACQGSTLSLTAFGAATYTWSGAVLNGVAFVPSASSLFTVTGTDVNGCKTTLTQSVTVNPLPALTVAGNATVCIGSATSFTPSGGTTYSMITNSGTSVTTAVFSLTPVANDTYTFTAVNANGCKSSVTKAILVNPLPTVTISGNMVLCTGQTATIVASGAVTYSWSNGSAGADLNITPPAGYNYMVTGKDANGCKNTATTNFSVHPLPVITALSSNTMICAGETATLSVSGANTYQWNTNSSASSITVSPVTNTTYSVTGTNTTNCSASVSIVQKVSECTGLEKNSLEQTALIYPNPNKGSFNIELNMPGNFTATIFNALGERVYSAKLEKGKNNIHLNESRGIYFYVILEGQKTVETGKIVVE